MAQLLRHRIVNTKSAVFFNDGGYAWKVHRFGHRSDSFLKWPFRKGRVYFKHTHIGYMI